MNESGGSGESAKESKKDMAAIFKMEISMALGRCRVSANQFVF